MAQRHETSTPEETEALGARLAATLAPGDVVLVEGELGSGKTTFVRGACRALGVEAPVTSPTFTIGQRYVAAGGGRGGGGGGRVFISHLDLYRIADLAAEEDPELLADYVGPDAIAFVEWPEGEVARFGRVAARVRIEHRGGDRRLVEIE
jgi:tRNA threonylcarbamoyladenosine biosynthesis protein TsaE